MESWDGWDDFLKVIASDHDLTVDQEAVYLVRLSRQSTDNKRTNQNIANEVIGGESNTALYAYNKRMKEVFDKLAQSFPEINSSSKGKVERTRDCLEKAYLEQQNKKKLEASSHAIASPDWQKVCREMLETQKQNLRRQATQMGFELNVYVPLGLVDRKHQSRRSSDFSVPPEKGSGFFQLSEEEIIQTYDNDEFLEQVIKQGQSKKSKGKRIAIIGEPGAGKTTLLESIAFSPKTPGFPIWISLGSLGEKSLEEYLSQKWLKDALKTSDVTQQQKELEELFKSGEVLLLLDGVDEMPASSPVEALAKIRDELSGWVADARVVLTCRVNVWDASANALQGFDTYRTLEFSYGDGNKPDRVREFICQWFSKAEKPELGEPLREKLEEDRHQRIRDLVKNPLRLSLLCQSWYFRQGDLPETKAALYEQFTRAFYDWKVEQFPTTPTQRKELNSALGLLAREAIDKEKSRFGIRESFAISLMGEDLFKLACKLHWLNFVYRDAETDEKVYAFFHPTFQEYFAACAVDDWHFFLNHVANNPAQGMYRIFKPQWKEVILLWLGREEQHLRQQKEIFIEALVKFEDDCDGFYRLRAYFLAASGIAEFSDCSCSLVDEILVQLIKWGFGSFNDEKKQMQTFLAPIAKGARVALTETVRTRAIDALIELLKTNESHYDIYWVCECLEQIGTGNPQVLTALATVLERAGNEDARYYVAMRLGTIAPGSRNQRAVREIVRLIEKTEDKPLRRILARNLEEIDPGNPRARAELAGVLEKTKDNSRHKDVAQGAVEIRTDNAQMIVKILRVLQTAEDENSRCIAATCLGEIIPGDLRAIKVLLKALETTENCFAATGLGEIGTANPLVIAALLKAIETTENTKNTFFRFLCIKSLKKIIQGEYLQSVVLSLRNYISAQIYANHFVRYEYCYEIILHCAQNMNYSDFYYAWHGQLATVQPLENQLIDIPS
jgi:hypothetical protein